ncbi:acyltransferase [Caballeronia sp. LZ043]|uniref:acyltransferase family protein n=1 Tax=Caballeronia sp. LZ043 TaxID=3038569 RepID=UPI0028552E0D|nr:acyltransferase [Caballeronia sp. LZ043]MDR5826161.1 acyltransferase [Caballeronia sp. LZ043]
MSASYKSQPTAQDLKFRPELDSLRAVAVITVLLSHWVPGFAWPVNWGYVGVYLFFVISGYVISRGLLRERDNNAGVINFKLFYARRIIRIWPIYYLCLGFMYFIYPGIEAGQIVWHITFLTNVLFGLQHNGSFPVHFWSLSVEEQFYLFWPFVALLRRRYLTGFCLACIMISPAARWVLMIYGHNLTASVFSLPSNLDCLAAGSLLAISEQSSSPFLRKGIEYSGWAGAAVFAFVLYKALFSPSYLSLCLLATSVGLVSVWLISWLGRSKGVADYLCNPVLQYLGRISYGIYVYHMVIGTFIWGTAPFNQSNRIVYTTYAFAFTVLVASLSAYVVETPLRMLKERYLVVRSNRLTVVDDSRSVGAIEPR